MASDPNAPSPVEDDRPVLADGSIFTILLAGGQGTRLHELTAAECKPAVWFGQRCRIVDFTLANAVRSGLGQMLVATQYCPGTLTRHLLETWAPQFAVDGHPGLVVRDGRGGAAGGYRGTADAVRANAAAIEASGAREVLVLAGDHVYDMDYRGLVAAHRHTGAKVTVAALAVPLSEAGGFGIIERDGIGRIVGFEEKPGRPVPMVSDETRALASAGIYLFDWAWLRAVLAQQDALLDFGGDVMPLAVAQGVAASYELPAPAPASTAYWRDVGTLDAYRTAVLEFELGTPPCRWPRVPGTSPRAVPDVTFSRSRFAAEMETGGLRLFAPLVRAEDRARWSVIDGTVVMPGARIAPGVRLTRCIVAPGTPVPEGLVVGEDPVEDARWFRVTPQGTTLITTAMLTRRSAGRGALFAFPRRRPSAMRRIA